MRSNVPDQQISLLYVHAGWIGYGRVGVNLSEQLERKGVTVYDHLEGSEHHYSIDNSFVPPALQIPGVNNNQVSFEGRKAGKAEVVCWVSVPSHGTGWYEGQVPICFTMWEGMRLPETFRQSFHEFETIICPSWQNQELFSKYHKNVKYVPLGIDPDRWKYVPRKKPERAFNFLIGGSGKRKGGDLAVKAFKKVFHTWPKDGPVPNLIMKSPKGEAYYGDRISTIGGYLPADEEVALYEMAHCYLQPSRGEGFGLQPLQAIAQGLPTILTNGHGHESFATLGLPIGWKPTQSDYFIFGDAGDWWEPNLDDLCDQMLDVYHNYERHTERAKVMSHEAREQYSWSHVTDLFLDAIDYRLGPFEGDTWHGVEEKLYPVVTNKNHYCENSNRAFNFVKGRQYWQSADMKRILFEGKHLDPVCLNDDDPENCGLSPEQLDRIEHYRAEMENCPNCYQQMNLAEHLRKLIDNDMLTVEEVEKLLVVNPMPEIEDHPPRLLEPR
jgi:glycosyltransferase involved in cell wall biosynthesis